MPKHAISEHLLPGEVKLIEKLLGDSCCKAMGIAELAISPIQSTVLTKQIHKFKWNSIIKPGVVCFNTDPQRNNDYYIKVFSMNEGKKIWEQRIDLNMKSNRRRRHLITFDGNLCGRGTICLNFIDNDEADNFAWEMSKVMKSQRTSNKGNRTSNKGNGVFSQKWVRNEIGEEEFEKLKVFLKVACMDVSDLDDQEKGPEVFQFYKDQIHGKEEIDVEKQDVYGHVDIELIEYEDFDSDEDDLPGPDTIELIEYEEIYSDEDESELPYSDKAKKPNPNVIEKKVQGPDKTVPSFKTKTGTCKGGPPPPPPPPPPLPPASGPLPPPSLINKTKPKHNRNTNTSGSGKNDLLCQIRGGTVLKPTIKGY